MFKMENRQIDRKQPKATVKEGKKGVFRVINYDSAASLKDDSYPLMESPVDRETSTSAKSKKSSVEKKTEEKRNLKKTDASPSKSMKSQKSKDQASIGTGKNQNSSRSRKSQLSAKMEDDNTPLVLMTWVGRKVNVSNVKKSLKNLITLVQEHMPPKGSFYTCCENFDTYVTGGLYPVVHMTRDNGIIKKILSTQNYLPRESIGEDNMIEQAVYMEVASVTPPGNKKYDSSVFAIAAFRSIEDTTPPDILIREWKGWTGSRGFMVDILQAGLTCLNVKFYVKKDPRDDPNSFFYVVTTEVAITEPNDEGAFVDILQRFRVERFLGYRTIYRPYDVTLYET